MLDPDSPRKFTRSRASVLLDLVRGLAAILVLIEHWRLAFFQDFDQLHFTSWLSKLLTLIAYVATTAGHQAVIIFFVLSGYLISKSIFRMHREHDWSWSVYLLHRLARLWTVLIPGLLLCLLWDKVGLWSGHAPMLYTGHGGNHMTRDVSGALSIKAFFGNLFFLQTLDSTFGSDGALWSLPYEFWYYILFPLALIAVMRSPRPRLRWLHGAIFLIAAMFLRGPILQLYPIWLFGVVLACLKPPKVRNWLLIVSGVSFFLLTFGAARPPSHLVQFNDYVYALFCTTFLWLLLGASEPVHERAVWVRFSRGLSRFSYTLYIAHTPFLLLIVALLLGDSRWPFTPSHIFVALLALMLTIAYCWLVAALTEFRTDRVRSFGSRFVLGHRERPTPHEAALAASSQDLTAR